VFYIKDCVTREELSFTDLPQPAVLVVGDESSPFSSEVWKGVVEAAETEHRKAVEVTSARLEPVLTADYETARKLLDGMELGWVRRPATRLPIPLQLSHLSDPDPRALSRHLSRLLDLFDVWAIVASASAGDVRPLREALKGIDIPLLVTTDSTTVPPTGHRSNEIRLMPSNKAQATAMLFTAIRVSESLPTDLGEETPLRGLPSIACSCEATPQAREYVTDLDEQLRSEARRHGIEIAEFNPHRDNKGPLIVIGYSDHAESIIERRVGRRLTILSDGCATNAVADAVERFRKDEAHYWHVARPEVELRRMGADSFSAVREAGRRLLTWDARNASDSDLPRTSLRDLIRNILSESSKLFTFDGIENVAPAYRVVPIAEGVDPEADLPISRSPDAPPTASSHLRVVE
jgi:hypothetical protein